MRTKITPCPTMGYDAKGTEKVLGEMSRKGWILKKAGTLWRYEEAEPKERGLVRGRRKRRTEKHSGLCRKPWMAEDQFTQ